MNRYISVILLGAFVSVFGCKELTEFNVNPNNPEEASPQFLLSNVLYEAANNQAVHGWMAGNLLAQHTANLEFFPVDRYDLGTNTELWDATYRLLNDIATMQAGAPENKAYQAVGDILRAHQAALLTDLWGDVPFSDALKGRTEGNFTPSYDTQEAIYTAPGGILDLLREAATELAQANDPLPGDIMYAGDLNRWLRLANSLRVRYLMRISARQDVGAELVQLVQAARLMESAADDALIPYLASAPNQWIIFNERDGRYTDVRMSATIDSVLDAWDDPRIQSLFKPTANSVRDGNPDYLGIPNGLSRESQNAFDLSDVSLLGARFRDVPDGIAAPIMRYSELQFCLAEAVSRGLISGDAQAYYQNGIQASFTQYDQELPIDYLSRPAVTLGGSQDLEKILTQKWLSLFLHGYEAWIEVRRTGLPHLKVPADNLNNDVFPRRFRYPENEQAVNPSNYDAAVRRLGEDTYNVAAWWEN